MEGGLTFVVLSLHDMWAGFLSGVNIYSLKEPALVSMDRGTGELNKTHGKA